MESPRILPLRVSVFGKLLRHAAAGFMTGKYNFSPVILKKLLSLNKKRYCNFLAFGNLQNDEN